MIRVQVSASNGPKALGVGVRRRAIRRVLADATHQVLIEPREAKSQCWLEFVIVGAPN